MNPGNRLTRWILIALVLAIVFHEVAHGWTARALGDPTAAELNRLSLNPVRHVDPVGTILIPGFLALVKAPILGWAKPVPVAAWKFRDPRRGMMFVAAAGPAMNFALAYLTALALHLDLGDLFETFAFSFILFNLLLGLFNLLPIPPFDGGHIVEGLLPRPLARKWAGMHTKALLIMVLLLLQQLRGMKVAQIPHAWLAAGDGCPHSFYDNGFTHG
mgnify:CR=1 FL=1